MLASLAVGVLGLLLLICEPSLAAYQPSVPLGIPVQYGPYIAVTNTTNSSNIRNNNANYNRPAVPYNLPYPAESNNNNYNRGNANSYGWNDSIKNRNINDNSNISKDVVMGTCTADSELLLQTLVTSQVKFLRTVALKEISFPDVNSNQRIRDVTCVVMKDNNKKGKATMEILRGGIGRSFVVLRFKGRPNVDATVQVFGHKM